MPYSQFINWDCAIQAADIVLPQLFESHPIDSVLDVGCGMGAWLSVAQRLGATRCVGVDGDDDAVAPAFHQLDLTEPFDVGPVDLVICLEVAEHLPESAAETIVDSICRHSNLVLFSAATPGQGGDGHINEQPHEYWDARFTVRGYAMETVRTSGIQASWYERNIRVFRCA